MELVSTRNRLGVAPGESVKKDVRIVAGSNTPGFMGNQQDNQELFVHLAYRKHTTDTIGNTLQTLQETHYRHYRKRTTYATGNTLHTLQETHYRHYRKRTTYATGNTLQTLQETHYICYRWGAAAASLLSDAPCWQAVTLQLFSV